MPPPPLRPTVGRLAPTPSGALHLGNVCAFAAAWLSVRAQQGRLLLRIEDVDRARANHDDEASIRTDLEWLGLGWDAETPRQSSRDYVPALAALSEHTYYCDCTRAEIHEGGGTYSGHCRTRGLDAGAVRFHLPDERIAMHDRARGIHTVDLRAMGDPVLRRRDGLYAYHLAVVADDLADAVTEVVRGEDLLDQTAVQLCVWRAFDAEPPTWLHTPLIIGPDGRKLSKSHGALHVGELRDAGWTVADIWRRVLPWLGLEPVDRIEQAIPRFRETTVQRGPLLAPPPVSAPVPAPLSAPVRGPST
jgi:glutamyl-Q tRNA(Asp) synthetase